MDALLVKDKNQTQLFEMIQKQIPANLAMVDMVSDLLNISADAAYRRIRGSKLIDFEEAVLLANHFDISLDTFSKGTGNKKQIQCCYTPLDVRDLRNHKFFLQNLQDDLDAVNMANDEGGEMIVSSGTISSFDYLPYHDLTRFILYSWSNSVYDFNGSYDDFVKNIDFSDLLPTYEKLVRTYQNTPSTEIWTSGTIDRVLTLLNHHFEMGHFADENFPLLLCEQLLEMIGTLQNWSEKAEKTPNGTPFKFYVSDIDFDNSFILFKTGKTSKCFLKLFTINAIRTSDEWFCREIENWLLNTEQRSTLISGASEKERYKFFNALRKKVRLLIDKIYLHNLKDWVKNYGNVSY